MPDEETIQQEQEQQIPVEQTNAFQAGFMAGYLRDNPNNDPSVDGYMSGYLSQREGVSRDELQQADA